MSRVFFLLHLFISEIWKKFSISLNSLLSPPKATQAVCVRGHLDLKRTFSGAGLAIVDTVLLS